MTLDDLEKLFDKAWAGLDEESDEDGYIPIRDMNRAGIVAVVTALRDELNRTGQVNFHFTLNEIVRK